MKPMGLAVQVTAATVLAAGAVDGQEPSAEQIARSSWEGEQVESIAIPGSKAVELEYTRRSS